VTVRERDLRALAGIVSQDRPDVPDGEGLPLSLLAELMGQIRCDTIAFQGFDCQPQKTWFVQAIPDPDYAWHEENDPVHWQLYWDCLVVVKHSWSIASLTRGLDTSLSSDTPHSDHPVTDGPRQPDQDEKRSVGHGCSARQWRFGTGSPPCWRSRTCPCGLVWRRSRRGSRL
jgi:hypothetical protein